MAGTVEGGKKAALKNMQRDPNFYARIGAKGGKNGTTGGFATYAECNCSVLGIKHHFAQCRGRKGGRMSKRRSRTE